MFLFSVFRYSFFGEFLNYLDIMEFPLPKNVFVRIFVGIDPLIYNIS